MHKLKKLVPNPRSLGNPQDKEIVFSFKDLKLLSVKNAVKDGDFFIRFLERLSKISTRTWSSAYTTNKHGIAGIEIIDAQSLNASARALVPVGIDRLIVMRAVGDNRPFLGYRDGNVFNVVFIEYNFGDVYNHG